MPLTPTLLLRDASRRVLRHPVFALCLVVPMGLAAGATTAMFAVVDQLLLRPVQGVVDYASLFRLSPASDAQDPGAATAGGASVPEYVFLRDALAGEISLIASGRWQVDIDVGGLVRRQPLELVSSNYFEVLGVRPTLGQLRWVSSTQEIGAPPVIVLDYRYWRRDLSGENSIVGKALRIGGVDYTVIGVADSSFRGLDPASPIGWIPVSRIADFGTSPDAARSRLFMWLTLLGRRPHGTPLTQVTAAVAVARRQDSEGIATLSRTGLRSTSLQATDVGDVRTPGVVSPTRIAVWLLELSSLILIIGCLNAGVLMVARGYATRAEFVIRLALGASSLRLLLEQVAEAGFATLAAGALAALLVKGTLGFIGGVIGQDLAIGEWHVQAFSLAALFGTWGLAALLPTYVTLRKARIGNMTPTRAESTTLRSGPLRMVVGTQAAIALLLTAAALGLVDTVRRATRLGLGVASDSIALVSVGWTSDQQTTEYLKSAQQRISQVTGVTATALSAVAPFYGSTTKLLLPPNTPRGDAIGFRGNVVEPGYFRAVGMRVLAGRDFSPEDRRGTGLVAVINSSMAKAFWGHADPVGQCLHTAQTRDPCTLRIVGVVSDAKLGSISEPPGPYVYTPLEQSGMGPLVLNVRAARPASAVLSAIRNSLPDDPPSIPQVQALSSLLIEQLAPWRRAATAVAVVALLSLALITFGTYSVARFTAESRRRELATQLALGATPARVMSGLVMERLRDGVLGCLAGALGAAAAMAHIAVSVRISTIELLSSVAVAGVLICVVSLLTTCVASRPLTRLDLVAFLRST